MTDAHWDYSELYGPKTWRKHYHDASGDHQSPVDIQTTTAEFDHSLQNKVLQAKFPENIPYTITNKGVTLAMAPILRDKHVHYPCLTGGPLTRKYEFDHFHVHWGSADDHGSEHKVNGKSYAAEIHFVHFSQKYMNMKTAVSSDEGLAVVGVFVQVGTENKAFKQLCDSLEKIKYKDESCKVSNFCPTSLLPTNCRDYWTYGGSLTTPPCYESVTWIVMKEPITVSEEQLKQLRMVRNHSSHEAPPHPGTPHCIMDNFRPAQPMNNRILRASFK